MQVQLTSPAKGKMPGESVTVTDAEGRWMLANGYARVDDDGDHRLDTSVEASADPTLAANREAPGTPPGTIANADEEDSWTEQVVSRQEFKGKSGSGSRKVVPGRPETLVAAARARAGDEDRYRNEATLDVSDVEQPEATEVEETVDPLADEDLKDAPEISAEDTPAKGGKKR